MMPSWREMQFEPGSGASASAFSNGHHAKFESIATRLGNKETIHLNSTPAGGGVAEILSSLIPLSQWHGLSARWMVIPPNQAFFGVTRRMHDYLQGKPGNFTSEEWGVFFAHTREAAGSLPVDDDNIHAWFIHDYQLLPVVELLPKNVAKVWVCHIDTSQPNQAVVDRLMPYIQQFDHVVFSLPEYVLPGVDPSKVTICPPAIDPAKPKNSVLDKVTARQYVAGHGIDIERPFIAQLSRYDHWKDPLGVIDSYRLAKQEVPGLQLALVGALTASDDSMAGDVLAAVKEHAGDDPDIHLYSDAALIDDGFVNAFQTAPDVILQKSTREGFGLTVTEAMWKSQAVIGGDVGGIRLQIQDAETGFLISDVGQCAERLVELLTDTDLRQRLGAAAHASVEKNYLLPRLMADYMSIVSA